MRKAAAKYPCSCRIVSIEPPVKPSPPITPITLQQTVRTAAGEDRSAGSTHGLPLRDWLAGSC